jgi:enoyl-CoA hydratase/carnithine racemase
MGQTMGTESSGPLLMSEPGCAVLREDRDGLKILTLDRPATSNALSSDIVEALLHHVRESAHDGTRTLVFRANGPNFCAGFDLSGLDEARDADLLARFVRVELLLQAVYMAEFDTIACARGAAYGAGADLFAACRYRLADPSARFAMPGLQFGLALGTRRFAALVGEAAVYEVLASGAPYDALRAVELGLASRIEEEGGWSALVQARHEGRKVSGEALAHLARLTRRDSRAEDMHALVESASEPGLVERVRHYRERALSRKTPK